MRLLKSRTLPAALGLALAAGCVPECAALSEPSWARPPASADDERFMRLLALQTGGRWREADDGFRALMNGERYRNLASMRRLVGAWKGFELAGNSFLQGLVDGGGSGERHEAMGRRLLEQGLASLAAVELERATMLGDTSEETYEQLLRCYQLNGDGDSFQRTLALLKSHHPFSGAPARLRPAPAARDAAATVDYPQWIAWAFPIGVSGHYRVNPLWRDGRLIQPLASPDGGGATVRSWNPATGAFDWEADLNVDLPGGGRRPKEPGTWRTRELVALSATDAGIEVRYLESQMRVDAGGGGGGFGVGSGTFLLDPRTGATLRHDPSSDLPRPPDYARDCPDLAGLGLEPRCVGAIQGDGDAFLLLSDLTVTRAHLRERRVRWKRRVEDAPGTTLYRRGDLILVPGAGRTLSALDAETGRLRWRYPVATDAALDVSGPAVIVVSGKQSEGLALETPRDLARRRTALVAAARRLDDELAERVLINALEADPSNGPAYVALAERGSRAPSSAARTVLLRYADLLESDDPAHRALERLLRGRTSLRWSARAGSERISGLAFDRYRAYLLGERLLVAVDKGSGRGAWTLAVDGYGSPEGSGFGQRLAQDGGKVFAFAGSRGIVAVDGATGKRLWAKTYAPPPGATWSNLQSPLAERGRVYGSMIYWDPRVSRSSPQLEFFALRAEDGALLWRAPVDAKDDRFRNGGGYVDLRPERARGLVYFPGAAGGLYALDEATGRLVWNFRIDRSTEALMLRTTRPLLEGTRVHFAGENGVLYSLDARSGKLKWKKSIHPAKGAWAVFNSVSRHGDRLCLRLTYSSDFGCLDAANGEPRWKQGGFFFNYPPVALRDAIVISRWAGHSGDSDMIVALDPKTGEIKGERGFPGVKFLTSLRTDGERLYAVHDNVVTQIEPFW